MMEPCCPEFLIQGAEPVMTENQETPASSDSFHLRDLPRNVKVLGLTSLLNDTASEMVFPLLPAFLITVLGGNKFTLGLIEGAAESVAGLLKLWSGGRSDQAGKRKEFVVFGYSMAVLTRPIIGLVVAPWQLFLLRITDRIGKGLRTAPRDALIADSTSPSMRGRAFGFHRAMDHLGAAIGPLLAACFVWIWPDGLRTLFLLTIIPGLILLVVLILFLNETETERPQTETLKLTLKPFDSNFKLYLMTLIVFTLGNSSDAFLLVRASELGVPNFSLPLLWCVSHLIKSSSNIVFGFAVDRFGPRKFIILGWMIYAMVYVGFGFATSGWHAWTLFLIYALFYGLTEPAEKSLVATLGGNGQKGLAYGWYHFSIGIATLPASMIFGAIYQYSGAVQAFAFGAVLAMFSSVMLMFIRTPPNSVLK